ncbi:MAG: hypothetical protein R3C56_33520 [Pirellulaceae bacterium]
MPRSFDVEHVPISGIRLQERLRMLGDDDKNTVEQVQRFLLWDRQQPERTDEDVQMEYDRLMSSVSNPLVRDIITYRMDVPRLHPHCVDGVLGLGHQPLLASMWTIFASTGIILISVCSESIPGFPASVRRWTQASRCR